MAHHIFRLETELQNIPGAAPEASPSFSVSEKLARYGGERRFRSCASKLRARAALRPSVLPNSLH
jgi:hypothetical protein